MTSSLLDTTEPGRHDTHYLEESATALGNPPQEKGPYYPFDGLNDDSKLLVDTVAGVRIH